MKLFLFLLAFLLVFVGCGADSSAVQAPLSPNHPPPAPEVDLFAPGEALKIAYEDDVASQVNAPNPIEFDQNPVPLTFNEFFVDFDPLSLEEPTLSDKLLSLDGERVIIEGYMSPALQLGLDWFMLTQSSFAQCPFHSSAVTITPDIALIYVRGNEIPFNPRPIRLEGEVHVGGASDSETDMFSLVRIYADEKDVKFLSLKELLDS